MYENMLVRQVRPFVNVLWKYNLVLEVDDMPGSRIVVRHLIAPRGRLR